MVALVRLTSDVVVMADAAEAEALADRRSRHLAASP
jgi:hypothetical protein